MDRLPASLPVVVLLHGVQSGSSTWWRVGADLADLGCEVIALDLPGHGRRPAVEGQTIESLATDVALQLDERGVPSADLIVGHSLGALVGLILLDQQPERAVRLLLEDPPTVGSGADPLLIADELLAAAATAHRDRNGLIAARLAVNPRWSRQDAVNSVENLQAVDVAAVTAMLRSAPPWDLPDAVARCAVPVELVLARGPGSATAEPARSQLLSGLEPELVTEADSGHSVHRDRPGVWVAAVLAALRRSSQRRTMPGQATVSARQIVAAERQLHQPAIRMDGGVIAERLDLGYTEIGRSGRFWTHDAMVAALATAEMSAGLESIEVDEERVRPLGESLYLLTYRTIVGQRVTRRSSIWRSDPDGLRVVFHQGTPVPD